MIGSNDDVSSWQLSPQAQGFVERVFLAFKTLYKYIYANIYMYVHGHSICTSIGNISSLCLFIATVYMGSVSGCVITGCFMLLGIPMYRGCF